MNVHVKAREVHSWLFTKLCIKLYLLDLFFHMVVRMQTTMGDTHIHIKKTKTKCAPYSISYIYVYFCIVVETRMTAGISAIIPALKKYALYFIFYIYIHFCIVVKTRMTAGDICVHSNIKKICIIYHFLYLHLFLHCCRNEDDRGWYLRLFLH
jgi:hypothetical protein